MAIVKPFKALRPVPELVAQVAALPYDVMNTEEARKMVAGNPYSFLHVDKPTIDFDLSIDSYDRLVYEKAKENLNSMIKQGIYRQDKKENFYIYQQKMSGRVQTGLVCCAAIDDYLNDVIKKHEYTRPDKELDRVNHVEVTDAHTGPIFLTFPSHSEIRMIVSAWVKNQKPEYDFISEDGIAHTCWVLDCESTIIKLSGAFGGIDYFYIADGHHRAASAVNVGLRRRNQDPNYTGKEEYNYFLAVLFPADELFIMDYNRVVKDLNGNTTKEFIQKINEKFLVEAYRGTSQYKPEQTHVFGMFLDNTWYKLTAKPGTYNQSDPVGRLDVSILQNNLLGPILGIKDPRTDQRIDFVGGIRGLAELERRVNQDMQVAFSMYPTSIEELMAVADSGKVMPPKSTWFEPKLRSGVFIHPLSK